MSFPATLTNALDGVTEIVAAHLNNLEAKVGVDTSAVPTSLDYLLKNAASIEPGHKHSKLWAADGSPEAVSVDAAGNVGIGTGSPGSKLHVASSATTAAIMAEFFAPSMASDQYIDIYLGKTTGTDLSGAISFIPKTAAAESFLQFGLYGTSGPFIVGKYNVGVGTVSPGKKLDVAGYARAIGLFNTLNSAPPDGDLAAGECALWFDKTDGAAKLMIKAKQNDGTVKTASISLS